MLVIIICYFQVIRLNNNQLEDIPKPAETTRSLTDLDVSGNRLGEIMIECDGHAALLSSVSSSDFEYLS